jgi:hypothetical protein
MEVSTYSEYLHKNYNFPSIDTSQKINLMVTVFNNEVMKTF